MVNIFYAHSQTELTPLQLDVMREICHAAAAAYARLIAVSKKKR
jgi:hypothetical protein